VPEVPLDEPGDPEPDGPPIDPPELEPDEPVLEPEDPELITSIRSTCPEGEKLARTWSPSLMSASDAGCPFFITCVESLTFSWSDSWFFDLSSLSTFPVTWVLLELDALPPDEPRDPDELVPLEPIEPLLLDPDDPVPIEAELPDEPLDFDGSEGLVVDEPELPEDPAPIESEDPDDPEDPLDCAAAGSAMRRPAIPMPAIIPLPIFMFPSRVLRCRRTRHRAVSRRVALIR
jgi:hypothetical protein